MSKGKRRIVGKIDKLAPALKDTVDQMLMSGESYREIVRYLAARRDGIAVMRLSVCQKVSCKCRGITHGAGKPAHDHDGAGTVSES